MEFQKMLDMLFILLERRRVNAGELAARYHVSVRTIYRYADDMTIAGVPVDRTRGPNGGISISDAYKLPRGFMLREEYERAIEALRAMESQMHDPVLRSAIQKLSSQIKRERQDGALSGNILVDGGTWGDERKFSDKLSLINRAIDERRALEIEYVDRGGERTRRVICPHLLVYKQNIWYTYAHCRLRGAFRLFKLGRIRSAKETGQTFCRIPFSREEIPLSFWNDSEKTVSARFQIMPEVLPFAEEWLGIENITEQNGGYYADVTLPDDESLVGKILSAGPGVIVLAPRRLAEQVKEAALRTAGAH